VCRIFDLPAPRMNALDRPVWDVTDRCAITLVLVWRSRVSAPVDTGRCREGGEIVLFAHCSDSRVSL
jgi:hypothetical protein